MKLYSKVILVASLFTIVLFDVLWIRALTDSNKHLAHFVSECCFPSPDGGQ